MAILRASGASQKSTYCLYSGWNINKACEILFWSRRDTNKSIIKCSGNDFFSYNFTLVTHLNKQKKKYMYRKETLNKNCFPRLTKKRIGKSFLPILVAAPNVFQNINIHELKH